MNKLKEFLQRAGADLGIQVIAPFELTLENGQKLIVEALLPDLGASKGMIVVGTYDDLRETSDELVRLGYGYSVLDEPLPNEDYDVETYVELFRDWGWGAENERRPAWME